MSEYIILKSQSGEGCDYTIACGKKYEFVTSDKTIDEMEVELVKSLFVDPLEAESMSIEEVASCCRIERDERWLEELILISVEDKEVRHIDIEAYFEKMLEMSKNVEEERKFVEEQQKDIDDLERLRKLYPDQFKQ